MTDIGRSISNSDATKKLHEIGASAQENPGYALAVGLTGGVLIAASPLIISAAPAIITTSKNIIVSDKNRDGLIGGGLGVATYAATTDSNDRTFSGYAYSFGTGYATGYIASPLTGAKAYGDITMTTTTRLVGGGGVGGTVEGISQLAQNDWDPNKLNWGKIATSSAATSLTTVLGGVQVGRNFFESVGLPNMTTAIQSISWSYLINKIQKDNEKKSDNK